MRKFNYLYIILISAFALASCNDNQRAKNYNEKTLVDQYGLDFIKIANEAGLTEIKASTLAQTISQNPRIVAFAKMMVADHGKAGQDLNQLAKNKYVDVSDTVNKAHQSAIDSLGKLTGVAFDKIYMQMMTNDHEGAVKLFTEASNNKSSAVQKFAEKYLPTIKMHLDSARAICAGLK